jgi:hypothetical protein
MIGAIDLSNKGSFSLSLRSVCAKLTMPARVFKFATSQSKPEGQNASFLLIKSLLGSQTFYGTY